ncbi:MAG: hypothetical protein KC466_20470, partial [Myxococcales bacterium]|nr:hypothetical protein [Myxococcales bacterium]
LTYEAPPRNEGYNLICIHPDPRHRLRKGEKAQVRVQVKSRYSTTSNRAVPLKEDRRDAFDFLVVVFLNIGNFGRGGDGREGAAPPEFYTLPARVARRTHDTRNAWKKISLRGKDKEMARYRDENGFERIAVALGVEPPQRRA